MPAGPRTIETRGPASLRRTAVGVDVLATGIGARLVEEALAWLGERASPALVVSTGAAGALVDELAAGDVIVADEVVSSGGERIATSPPASQTYRRAAESVGSHALPGALLSAAVVLATAAAKRRAHLDTGALAVDMEAAAVGRWARSRGLPFVAVKAVLDTARMPLPAALLAATDERGTPRPWQLLKAVARRPAIVLDVVRLGAALRPCRRSLAAVHRAALPRLAADLQAADRPLQSP